MSKIIGEAKYANPRESQLLLLLARKDHSIQSKLERSRLKYTHNAIQNELLDLMAQDVIQKKLTEIKKNNFFATQSNCQYGKSRGFSWFLRTDEYQK